MASPEDIAISREFMAAKRAYEISEGRIKRLLKSWGGLLREPPGRRPVGSEDSVKLSPVEIPSLVSRTDMNLHIHAFVRYVEAHRAYFRGRPAEFNGAIRKSLGLLGHTQALDLTIAEKDIKLFMMLVVEERCGDALREYDPKSPGSVAKLLGAVEMAQHIPGAATMPAVRKATEIANSHHL